MKVEETTNFVVYDKALGFKVVDEVEAVSNWALGRISVLYIAKACLGWSCAPCWAGVERATRVGELCSVVWNSDAAVWLALMHGGGC